MSDTPVTLWKPISHLGMRKYVKVGEFVSRAWCAEHGHSVIQVYESCQAGHNDKPCRIVDHLVQVIPDDH